ncbi:MAG: hypothetical protein ACKV2V_29220 [Blastocatellia bacterium]
MPRKSPCPPQLSPVLRSVILTGMLFLFMIVSATAQTRKQPLPGQRAIVIDDRLSAVREKPDVRAPIRQRLGRGRVIGVASAGARWHQVYVSRRTRGWILADAIARSGRAADAARLLQLIETIPDEFQRARLARMCATEFRHTATAPKALLLLGQAAAAAGERLTRDARRRMGDAGRDNARLPRREFMLSFAGLDRWNRAGITFSYDAAADRIVYDGAAYRDLQRHYPRSAEARQAAELQQAATRRE